MIRKSQDAPLRSLDDAIAWHVRITSPDADEKVWAEFASWLDADSSNRIAFDHVEDFDYELSTISPLPIPIAAQSKAKIRSNYFSEVLGRFRATHWAWVTSAVALAASSVLVLVFITGNQEPIKYATHIGETRTVMLVDGTKIDMNTATKILVTGEVSGRHVILEQGEALFHVARDPAHPFIVTVGDRDVRDLGTVFNVLRTEGTITVVVAEGKVAVTPHNYGSNIHEVTLAQGDQLVHSEGYDTSAVEHVDIAHALAWREGYLIYDNAPLSKVVRDLNRYFPNHVILENNDVAARRFSGALHMDNENAVLERISKFLPVSVHHYPNGNIVLRNARNGD